MMDVGIAGVDVGGDRADAAVSTVENVCGEAVELVCTALSLDRASLLLCDEAKVMRFKAWRGLSKGYREAAEGHSPWDHGERHAAVVLVEDVAEDTSLARLRRVLVEEGIHALAFVPVMAAGRLLGTFVLYYDSPHAFTQRELDLAGAIAGTVGVAIESSLVTEDLRASRNQLRAVFEGLTDGITVIDQSGRLLLANEAAANLCGFASAGEMMSLPIGRVAERFELLDEDGHPLSPADTPGRRVLAGEALAEMTIRCRLRGTQQDRWSIVKATPIRDTGRRVQFAVSVFRDVTRERRLMELDRLRAEVSGVLTETLDVASMLARLADLVVPDFADGCSVHELDEGRASLLSFAHGEAVDLRSARELATPHTLTSEHPDGLGRILLSGLPRILDEITDPVLVGLASDVRHLEWLRGAEITAAMVIPIPGPPKPSGVVSLVSSGSGRMFSAEDLAVAVELSSLAGLAVRNGQLHAAEREARAAAEAALDRLGRLTKITDAAIRSSSTETLLKTLLEAVREAVNSDRAAILLLEGADELVVQAAVGIDDEVASGVRVPLGAGLSGTIAATRTPLVIDDLSTVEVVSAYLRDFGGSFAGVPLVFADRLLGVLHVSSDRIAAFDSNDTELLRLAGERAAIAIEQTRLFEREREIAGALQQSLLPERFPRLPGVVLAASYLPATDGSRVGGDWYDAFPLRDGRIAVAIGDVVGHGIEAAAAMGQVRNGLAAYAHEDSTPCMVLHRLNDLLTSGRFEGFCTAFYAVLDPWSGCLTYANAGHPPPLAVGVSGVTRFLDDARSTPLGALEDASYENRDDRLEPGTILFAYTDGLVERRDERLDVRLEFLASELSAAHEVALRRLPSVITGRLLGEDAQRQDDVAMIVVQLASAVELNLRLPADSASLAVVRRALDGFLSRAGATPGEIFDLKVACGEACANVIEHAYGGQTGFIRLNGSHTDTGVEFTIRDTGSWDESEARDNRGRGILLIRELVDELEINAQEPSGTQVRLKRRLRAP